MAGHRRALLSCHDKTGIVELAKGLSDLGFQLLSTGGTATHLRAAGLQVTDVSAVTGFPEIMDGRVKTIHPAIAAGLLARPTPAHEAALTEHGLRRIDLLAVNLYPFTRLARDPNATFETLVENIDIGGPTMLRAAAKNHEAVLVLVDPADYAGVLAALGTGVVTPDERLRLALKVFRHTAMYDATIAARLEADGAGTLPANLVLPLERVLPLRYGENPHQAAAYYATADATRAFDIRKRGKELSYNNLLDVDAAWALARTMGGTSAVVIKHGNPCGVARARAGEDLATTYRRARQADSLSAFGSIVGLSVPLDEPTACAIGESFVEVVVAPEIPAPVRELLAAKKNLRMVELDPAAGERPYEMRAVLNGLLVQTPDSSPDPAGRVVTKRHPSEVESRDLDFAMRVCRHVKSNAIVLARDEVTVGIGAGQMSRVDSVRIASSKAEGAAAGSVLASDAFFPFPDGVIEAHGAGVAAIIQPGGSVKDAEVIAEADRLGMAMLFTGQRHFRH